MNQNKPMVRIAVSYAKKDQGLLDELKKHLSPLTRSGYVDTWDDRNILAGTEWATEVDTRLKTAHIILLLVSPDFIASDYCYSIEVMQALAMHEKGDARVLPIILRPIEWAETPFGKLQPLPSDRKPIVGSSWLYTDEAFADVARGIQKVVEEVRTKLLRGEHMMKLFVSYSRHDRTSVYTLVQKLKNKAEYYVWIDQVLSGDQLWWDTILDQVDECESFVPILTPYYAASASCIAQLHYALALKKTILPLILKPCELPEALRAIPATDISTFSLDDRFLRTTRALANIETDRLARGYAVQMKAPRPSIPYEPFVEPETSFQKGIEGNRTLTPLSISHDINSGTKHASAQAQVELGEQEAPVPAPLPEKQASHKSKPALQSRPVTVVTSDGKPMQLIPASKFLFGDGQVIELGDYYIDTWPVTNKEYQGFLLEQNVMPPITWRGGKFPQNKADHPVTGVSWFEAMAYASWAGKRLPTVAEWEKAARGSDGRRYPWGEIFDVKNCNTIESKYKGTTPITQHQSGVSIYGVLDMAGNVWEWTTDEVIPRGMGHQNQGTKRALKGGSWNTPKGSAECAMSTSAWPRERLTDAGFRCVLSMSKA